ncbi:MAG: CDP-alcohol phosphatidyltransferase family protein [Gaiellaceae bacterium]
MVSSAFFSKPTADPDAPSALLARSRKQRPATEILCEHVFRPLAHLVVLALLPLRVPPPAVVLAATTTGLFAATELWRGNLLAAAVLLQLKTVLDNADGQLARASGRISVLGRYLDSESDLLVDAALFAAIGHVTGRPWLALAGFLALTFVLSLDYNLERLYRAERGTGFDALPDAAGVAGLLRRVYMIVYWPHDRLIERFVAWRVRDDGPEPRLAYHDRGTLAVLTNLGLSTQLAVLGVLLAIGHPGAYCWLVLGLAGATGPILLRRELLVRRARTARAARA